MSKILVKAEFWLSGDSFDVEKATKVVGIAPTETRQKVDFHITDFASVCWQYDTGYQESEDIEEQLLQLQEKLDSRYTIIREFCKTYNIQAGFCIVIKTDNEHFPGTSISKEFVSLAAKLDAKIEFDLYCNLGEMI